jgi:hypothetical protein
MTAPTDRIDRPTPSTTLAARCVRVMLTCWHCHDQADADLPALIAAGRGDVPLIRLRWRGAWCKSDRIDMIRTSHARVLPWINEAGGLARPSTLMGLASAGRNSSTPRCSIS